ncbi:MAG: aminopeptidase [Syntrophomonadaceae bacterium]|nr:aminopeptidase [Syntrophomonadaceae bacterium]MDD3023671.1 aminopeptidase [Syntrophomonadaceae bacterium]
MAEIKESMKRNAWLKMESDEIQAVYEFNRGYLEFLSQIKTEREAADYFYSKAREHGFVPLSEVQSITAGQKIVLADKGKVCALLIIGQEPLINGINLVASHIDSPRLDLKARPLYEADGQALFKTHYYGGIKKYQWVAVPLALHGVVVKKDGKTIKVAIGEKEDDLAFTIADLLPHLAKDQMELKMSEAIKGESLNILVGSRPLQDSGEEGIKKYILDLLKSKYEIEEDDFTSAELQMVPAYAAREIGFDRSMIGAYGQDDRVCAYTSFQAILEVEKPQRTILCLFVDKEEIGSAGNTGLQSLIIENIMAELLHKAGVHDYFSIRRSLANSYALSADVNAAVDPNYPEVFEKMNCSFLGNGVVMTKYTGSRGKSDSNDANPEFLGRIRKLFDEHKVAWQIGELGKVDIGGGGTVAQYMARYGMEVVDLGVALLGMHSPFEVASKADVYMAYRAYKAFMQDF